MTGAFPSNRIAELDGLRGIAILAVLAVHSYSRIYGGWLGVDLFFTLSGYLITRVLVNDASLARFYRRRLLRIVPPLIAAIALAYAIAPGFDAAPIALFYANFVPRESLGSMGHTWSLSIEEQFYLVWPTAFIFLRRRAALATVIGVAICFRLWMVMSGADHEIIYRHTLSRMDSLAIGCWVALVTPKLDKRLGYAALGTIVVAFLFARQTELLLGAGLTLFAVLCATLVATAQAIPLLRNPALRYIGERSYGMYLYHLPVFYALAKYQDITRKPEWIAIAILKILVALVVTEISYRTIERLHSNRAAIAVSRP